MNKHILTTIDHQLNPGKYTKEQLKQNAFEAAAIYHNAVTLLNADVDYAYAVYATVNTIAATYTNNAATGRLIDQYFVEAKEDRQDYIDEINRRGKK